jgi:hypothetical protein
MNKPLVGVSIAGSIIIIVLIVLLCTIDNCTDCADPVIPQMYQDRSIVPQEDYQGTAGFATNLLGVYQSQEYNYIISSFYTRDWLASDGPWSPYADKAWFNANMFIDPDAAEYMTVIELYGQPTTSTVTLIAIDTPFDYDTIKSMVLTITHRTDEAHPDVIPGDVNFTVTFTEEAADKNAEFYQLNMSFSVTQQRPANVLVEQLVLPFNSITGI